MFKDSKGNETCYCEECLIKQEKIDKLRAENEELKQECDLYKTWYRAKHNDLKNYLGQLKAENEELKKLNEQLATYYPQENNELLKVKLENEELKDSVTSVRIELDKQKTRFKKHIAKLEQENEELRNLHINLVGVKECEIKELIKYKQCLDEIEEVAKNGVKDDCGMPLDELSIILQLIRQVKEGVE